MKKAVAIIVCSLVLPILAMSVIAQGSPQDLAGGGDELIDIDQDGHPDCIGNNGHCDACLNGVFEDGFCKVSGDKNNDGEIDSCDEYYNEDLTQGPMFVRGDSNGDTQFDTDGTLKPKVNLADAINTLNFLFQGGPEPGCMDAADANDDGRIDITDAVYTLNFLFSGGDPPQTIASSWYACEGEGVKDRCLSIQPDFPNVDDDKIKWETCRKTNFDGTTTITDCYPLFDQCQCGWKWWYHNKPLGCDIYSYPDKVDSLTCNKGITKDLVTEDACDPERKDENGNKIANEGCENLQPQPFVMAPSLLDIAALASMPQTDYGLKLLDLSRGYDLTELNVRLISGKEGIDPDDLASQIDLRTLKNFFTLEPSLDELNVPGVTPVSISGSVEFWERFKNTYPNFPPLKVHAMRFTLSDRDENGRIRSSFIDVPWRYAVEESDMGLGVIWQGDQNVPAGSTGGAGVRIVDKSPDDCTCSGIEMYYQWVQCNDENTCRVSNDLPFPPASFYVDGFNVDGKGQEGPFTLRTFDGAMEVLGGSPLFVNYMLQGQLRTIPIRKDIAGRPMDEYGVGDVTGIILLSPTLSRELKQRGGEEGIFYQYPIVYDGFHYQVEATTNGNCMLTEFMQSSARIGDDVRHLACDEWKSSLEQWPPTTEDMKKPLRHEYISASQIEGTQAAGIGYEYSCPNGFTPRDRYAPSWGYTNDAGDHPLGVYFENIVKKESNLGPVLQNTLMHMRNQDPQRSIVYRIFDVVGLPDQGSIDSPGVKCGCFMDIMYSDGSWQVVKEPNCAVYNSPGR